MSNNKEINQTKNQNYQQVENNKKSNDKEKIKGKIEVPDTRERRDGPGGN